MRRWLPVGLALLAAAGAASAQDPSTKAGPPKGSSVDAELQAKVNRAIARGVTWLRGSQKQNGEFDESILRGRSGSGLGENALALYTLRACGAPADDPTVKAGFEWLRAAYLRVAPRGLDNYGASLIVLALETHHAAPQPPEPDTDRYGRSVRPVTRLPEPDLAWMRELTAWIVAAQSSDGGFGYVSPGSGYEDHSNTQYSLLALKAARRCGIEVPDKLWRNALRHLLEVQERDGPVVPRKSRVSSGGEGYAPTTRTVARDRARGWGYHDGDPATGSMTSGGVSSLAICRSELRGKRGYSAADDARAEQAMHDGIAWLGVNFTVRANPAPPGAPMAAERWHYYFLYGLERAGIFAEVALMGEHDWYREGAEYLVAEQREGGSWSSDRPLFDQPGLPVGIARATARGSLLDTCWALLFLKRASTRLARGVATGEDLDLSGAESLGDEAFASLFDRVFGRFAGATADRRAALAKDFVRLGTRSIPRLLMRLEDPDPETRRAALEALRTTTGETHGYDAGAAEAERTPAVARWEEWWIARRDRLQPDLALGRFVERRS